VDMKRIHRFVVCLRLASTQTQSMDTFFQFQSFLYVSDKTFHLLFVQYFSKVVSKYLKVSQDKPAHVTVKQEGEFDLLEIHFPLVRETAMTQRRGI